MFTVKKREGESGEMQKKKKAKKREENLMFLHK